MTLKQAIETQVQYSTKDLQIAYKLHFSQVPFWKKYFMLLFGVVVIALAGVLLIFQASARSNFFIYLLFVYGIGLFIYQFWFHATIGQRMYKKIPDIRLPYDVKIDESGVLLSNVNVASNLEWSKYIVAIFDKEILLLYVYGNMFHIFPKRIFSNKQFERVMGLVQKNIERKIDLSNLS